MNLIDNMEEYPIFDREDCPNKIVEYLDKRQKERDKMLSNQVHEYHMEVLSIKQMVVDHRMYIRLTGIAIIILLAVFLIG